MRRARVSGVGVFYFADTILILAYFLRGDHPALVIQHHATDFIRDVLRRLEHQLKVLQLIAVGWHLHENGHARRLHITHVFRIEGAGLHHVGEAEQRRATAARIEMAMVNIHVTKHKAGLLNAVAQQFAVDERPLMRGNAENDNRFFALSFYRLWRFGSRRLRFWRGLRSCYRLLSNRLRLSNSRLMRLRSGLCGLRCRDWLLILRRNGLLRRGMWLMHRCVVLRLCGLLYRSLMLMLMHRLLAHGLLMRLNRLANRLVMTHRLLHLTFIRRLILVLRCLTGSVMLPGIHVLGRVHPMNANFTYAFNIVIKVIVLRLFVIARLHTFQWAIAKHRGTFFTAGPETVYQ